MRNVSAVIRAVSPNSRLENTIASLRHQTLPPSEIIVTIPTDLGSLREWDEFQRENLEVKIVHSNRGMVSQRRQGILAATYSIALLLDDDVILSPDVVKNLCQVMEKHRATCVVPEVGFAHATGMRRLLYSAFLIEKPTRKRQGISLLKSGGYAYSAYNVGSTPVVTHGGMGLCVLVDRTWTVQHNCLGDLTLEMPTNPYALREDGALILQHVLSNGLVLMADVGHLEHLGGTTALDTNRAFWSFHAQVRNGYRFWRSYVLAQCYGSNRWGAILSFCWMQVGFLLLAVKASLANRSFSPVRGIFTGVKDAILGR